MTSNDEEEWTVVVQRSNKRKEKKDNNNPNDNPVQQPKKINRPQGPLKAHIDQGRSFISFGHPVQDWDQVTFKGSQGSRKSMVTTKEKRPQRLRDEARHLAKIDEETETFHHKRVSKDLSRKIQHYRTSNHLTQRELAQKLNLPVDVVQDYEKGSAIPDTLTTNKFNKLLN